MNQNGRKNCTPIGYYRLQTTVKNIKHGKTYCKRRERERDRESTHSFLLTGYNNYRGEYDLYRLLTSLSISLSPFACFSPCTAMEPRRNPNLILTLTRIHLSHAQSGRCNLNLQYHVETVYSKKRKKRKRAAIVRESTSKRDKGIISTIPATIK